MKCDFCGKTKAEGDINWVFLPPVDLCADSIPCCPECIFKEVPVVTKEELDRFDEHP